MDEQQPTQPIPEPTPEKPTLTPEERLEHKRRVGREYRKKYYEDE